jgi:hypothetical protein
MEFVGFGALENYPKSFFFERKGGFRMGSKQI